MYIYSTCIQNAKSASYPTVILRLCCGYHLVRERHASENESKNILQWSEKRPVMEWDVA